MRTKEKLGAEIADWIKRSAHESRTAFVEGDLWRGLVAGARVFELGTVELNRRTLPYENGPEVEDLWKMVEGITSTEDYGGRISKMLAKRSFMIGMDLSPGSDMTMLTQCFKKGLEEIGVRAQKALETLYVEAAVPGLMDRLAEGSAPAQKLLYEEKLRHTPFGKTPMTGKHYDSVIIDDPLKK